MSSHCWGLMCWLAPGQRVAGQAGGPVRLPVRRGGVGEAGLTAVDHAEGARPGGNLLTGVAVHQVGAAVGRGRVRGDQGAHGGPGSVRADEQVAGGLGAVGEHGDDAALGRRTGVDEPLAVFDAATAAQQFVGQGAVEVRALECAWTVGVRMIGPHHAAGVQGIVGGDVLDVGRPESRVDDRVDGVDRPQRVHAVVHDEQPGTHVVPAVRVCLVDGGADTGLAQCHGGHGAGDAGADDKCVSHEIPFFRRARDRARSSRVSESRPRPAGGAIGMAAGGTSTPRSCSSNAAPSCCASDSDAAWPLLS